MVRRKGQIVESHRPVLAHRDKIGDIGGADLHQGGWRVMVLQIEARELQQGFRPQHGRCLRLAEQFDVTHKQGFVRLFDDADRLQGDAMAGLAPRQVLMAAIRRLKCHPEFRVKGPQ